MPMLDDVEIIVLRFAAEDSGGHVGDFLFEMNINQKPILNQVIPNQESRTGIPFDFIFDIDSLIDPDGYILEYSLDNYPTWLNFDPMLRRVYGEPGVQDLGTETITVIGTDITGGTGWTTLTILIKRNYVPVIIVPFQDMYAEKDVLFTQAFPDSNFFDANTDPADDL